MPELPASGLRCASFSRNAVCEFDLQFAGVDGGAVGTRQRTDLNSKGLAGRAAEIEILCELAERPMIENIVPPRIVFRGRHVIGHDIEQQPQAARARLRHECGPCLLAAQIDADPRRISDVVAVQTTGVRLQTRRKIDVADA